MTDPRVFGLLPLSDFPWPVTYRYHVQAPWGSSQQELTVNVPPLVSDVEATVKYGRALWQLAVAGATSALTRLVSVDVDIWRLGVTEIDPVFPPIVGNVLASAAPREETPAIQIHSGLIDGLSCKSFPFVGAPAGWTQAGLVTFEGLQRIEQTSQRLIIASNAPPYDFYFGWLLAYRDVKVAENVDPIALGFRYVQYVRVLHHTVRAPDPSPFS